VLNPFHEVNWRPGLPELRKFALSLVVGFPCVATALLVAQRVHTGAWAFSPALPLATAGIAGFLSARASRTVSQSIGAAFLTLTAILTILGFAAMEGVICVLMAAPLVGLLGIVGALLGHWLATLTTRPAYQVQSAAWLAVIVCAVGESITPPAPLEDVVSSEVIINATPAEVWKQLKDIRDLPAPTEPLFVFGVAHPLETYVVGEGGVGGGEASRC
jgi:hypothetical protein